ncbi:MAG: TetR family transcriptional regulator [Alphaproteobacteria bacterium]|nr:TetR family transcriptional regulator [Alphaproteobacteria bacterium]MBU1516380.1 TetR family transcriptional regulator [Alphaproteobacteria bacterium]MBU2093383.1 TetR family transcriptional regulator [Alphaproteobacteria bacterium]MBU2153870.1 TetR family transcriptional regulator [Alphaproteobacteria bacterium]MBU2307742.1 TetR family transcriptional regulator [Alphaproteobacteria bacterium]
MPPQSQPTAQVEPRARKTQIADAAIRLLATGGLRAITHRDVARTAQVSLAATTYYYSSKDEILALASKRLLDSYTDAVRRAAREIQLGQRREPDFRAFVRRLLWAGAGRNREGTLAWCEVMLELARSTEGRATARAWYAAFEEVLADVAHAIGVADPAPVIQSAIHTTAGLMLMIVALGLDPRALADVLDGVADPLTSWAPRDLAAEATVARPRTGAKARRTQEAILEAAVEIVALDGPAALSYRTLSERTGLTASAPAYHFASIERILGLALGRLLDAANDRLLDTFARDTAPHDLDGVLARMMSHLEAEAGVRRPEALAALVAWAHASRDPALTGHAWRAIGEQNAMWTAALRAAGFDVRPVDALLCQAMLAGRLVRLVAIGARPDEVTASAAGFRWELDAITSRRSYI